MAWDIRGKNVLVTGATSGIGLEASVELARRGARVTMVGRDRRKTEAAVAEVKARSGSGEVSFLLCDFSSQAEIRRLAQEVLARHERLACSRHADRAEPDSALRRAGGASTAGARDPGQAGGRWTTVRISPCPRPPLPKLPRGRSARPPLRRTRYRTL